MAVGNGASRHVNAFKVEVHLRLVHHVILRQLDHAALMGGEWGAVPVVGSASLWRCHRRVMVRGSVTRVRYYQRLLKPFASTFLISLDGQQNEAAG